MKKIIGTLIILMSYINGMDIEKKIKFIHVRCKNEKTHCVIPITGITTVKNVKNQLQVDAKLANEA